MLKTTNFKETFAYKELDLKVNHLKLILCSTTSLDISKNIYDAFFIKLLPH